MGTVFQFNGWNAWSIIKHFGQELVTPAPKTSVLTSSEYYDYLNVVTSSGVKNACIGDFISEDGEFLKVTTLNDLREVSEYPGEELPSPVSLPENMWELYNAMRSYTSIESGTVEFDKNGEIQRLIVNFKLK